MLDTYIIDIPIGSYRVKQSDFNRFTPFLRLDGSFYQKFVNNPTAQDKKTGIYKPKLTIYKRGITATLRIEASAGEGYQ